MANRRNRLEAAEASLIAELDGIVTIEDSSHINTPYHIRRPTGIISLDIAMKGGFPGGTVVQIHGTEGVGKTGLCFRTVATSQMMFGDSSQTFFASFGYKFDGSLARLAGMNIRYSMSEISELGYDEDTVPEEILAVQTIGTVKVIDITKGEIAKSAPSEAIFQATTELLETGAFQIGILDEMGSGETRDDVVKEFRDEKRMASWARLVTNWCIRLYTKLRTPTDDGTPVDTTLMVVNPARANINTTGARVMKQTRETSGRALAHAKAIDIHLSKGASKKKGTEVVSFEVKWKIAKGKHGVPTGATGQYIWLVDSGPDIWGDLATQAKKYGVISQKGRYITLKVAPTEEEVAEGTVTLDEEGYKSLRFEGGLDGFANSLKEDNDLFFDVYHATLETALGYNPLVAAYAVEED